MLQEASVRVVRGPGEGITLSSLVAEEGTVMPAGDISAVTDIITTKINVDKLTWMA